MLVTKVAALALIAGAISLATLPVAHAAPDCSASITLADWGENPAGYIDIAPGESCQFAIRMRGTVSSSEISQKPSWGKLKKLASAVDRAFTPEVDADVARSLEEHS